MEAKHVGGFGDRTRDAASSRPAASSPAGRRNPETPRSSGAPVMRPARAAVAVALVSASGLFGLARPDRNFGAADLEAAVDVGWSGDSFTENHRLPSPYALNEPLNLLPNTSGERFNAPNFGVSENGPGQPFLHREESSRKRDLDDVFHLYRDNDVGVRIGGGRIVYEKPPPCRTDPDEPFFLHVAPADANDLDDEERRAVGFDNLAFREGFWRADRNRCVGERELPNYDIAHLRTGQFDPQTGDATWETSFLKAAAAQPPDRVGDREPDGRRWIAGASPAAQPPDRVSPVALHRVGADVRIDGGRLVYEKPPPCRTDPDEPFFLHVAPADANDLDDEERRAVGFDNLAFREGFWRTDRNRCVGERELPNYDIASLRTGQFDPQTGDAIWETSFPPVGGANPAEPPTGGDDPGALDLDRADFRIEDTSDLDRVGADVRIDGGRLVYEKPPPCRTDPDEPFFLHVAPADANDLDDEERRAVGFDNLAFREGFWRADRNRCVGERELPNYDVAHLRTGQFDPQTGDAIWETSFLKGGGANPVAPPPGDDDLQAEVAAQIAAVNGRIDDLRAEVAMQFAAVNARIDDLHGELRVLRALVIDAVKGTAPPD